MELGYAGTPLRRKLVEAVLRGDKTATAGLYGDELLPQAGDRFLLLDFDDRPVAVVETIPRRHPRRRRAVQARRALVIGPGG
jgi:uncharacterized protein YhfF